jgi:ADP-dependent NAD(P)H-hydrate dehydratase / NAD(P)H-hydrate epimerase
MTNLLHEWCAALPDAHTMRAIDRWAIEERGVPSLDLMERAGMGVAAVLEHIAPDGPVVVVCGKGNNGGDGLVVARVLREAGRAVRVVCAAPPEQFSGDARENLARLPGDAPVRLSGNAKGVFAHAAVIVDALLGTGFQGTPHGSVAEAIELLNAADAPVVSVDVPSGVDSSTGVVATEAVCADITVTFHAAKPGLWIRPGKAHAGEVRVIDIGIPRGAPCDTAVGLIDAAVLDVLPRRGGTSTKFASGHVIVAGGSRGLIGAPSMATRACMRAGAGYVTACVPSSLLETLAGGLLLEVMTRGLPDDEHGALTSEGVQAVLDASERGGAPAQGPERGGALARGPGLGGALALGLGLGGALARGSGLGRALALGPGLGRSEGAFAFARELARRAQVPLVLDADGLNAHAGQLDALAAREAATVLTPHAGELGRLLGLDSAQIERERLRRVREAARQARAVVVLKGDDTLIADEHGRVAVSAGGSPALATAGTGDVLTGVISALLAQGLDAFTAAAAGVCMHAEAGREAARRQGAAEGVIASDVIAALPAVRGARIMNRTPKRVSE